MKNHPYEVTVSNRTILRVVFIIILSFLSIKFIADISHALELIIVSIFLAIGLSPAVNWIVKKLKLKGRATATLIAYVIVIFTLGVLIFNVVPPLIKQTVDFVQKVPTAISELRTGSSPAAKFVQRYDLEDDIDSLSIELSRRTSDIKQPVVTTAGKVGSAFITTLTILILTFMLLVEGPKWVKRYFKYLPKNKREHHSHILNRMYSIITGYVNGQLLIAFIASICALLALVIATSILEVTLNVVALAGIVFITSLIPMIGAIIGAVIVILSCLFVSAPLALIMAVYLILYQQLENSTLQPYIQAKNNELTPLLVFVAALVGANFAGLIGVVLAIPAAGCLKVLVLDFLQSRVVE